MVDKELPPSHSQIDTHFSILHDRLANVPELLTALELATLQPELAERIYGGYIELISTMAGLDGADRQAIHHTKDEMMRTHGSFGTASEVSADELLTVLGDKKDILIELANSSSDQTSPYTAPALDELVRRMEGGHQLKLSGKQPSDDDEESRQVIWGHTMITDPEALIHFVSCHYLERYFAIALTDHGNQLARQKDFMLNALIDMVLLDHVTDDNFSSIYEVWSASKEAGGLGWVTNDRLASYNIAAHK